METYFHFSYWIMQAPLHSCAHPSRPVPYAPLQSSTELEAAAAGADTSSVFRNAVSPQPHLHNITDDDLQGKSLYLFCYKQQI